tara:strand:+ start:1615 stop:2253 length:639 start_codon:yes stop_codon:yes gene_type:complete
MTVNASALITRQEVLDYMELSSVTPAQGTLLDNFINAETSAIQRETGRKFKYKAASDLGSYNPADTPYDSVYDGTGTSRLFVRNYPIISVATLQTTYVTSDGIKDVSTINSDDYRIYYQEGIIELTKSFDVWGRFYEQPQSVELNYHAGYGTIPDDLKMAAWEEVAIRWRSRRRDGMLKRQSLGRMGAEYDMTRVRPEWVSDIIQAYKRVNL